MLLSTPKQTLMLILSPVEFQIKTEQLLKKQRKGSKLMSSHCHVGYALNFSLRHSISKTIWKLTI